jgi:hypothetical protein
MVAVAAVESCDKSSSGLAVKDRVLLHAVHQVLLVFLLDLNLSGRTTFWTLDLSWQRCLPRLKRCLRHLQVFYMDPWRTRSVDGLSWLSDTKQWRACRYIPVQLYLPSELSRSVQILSHVYCPSSLFSDSKNVVFYTKKGVFLHRLLVCTIFFFSIYIVYTLFVRVPVQWL